MLFKDFCYNICLNQNSCNEAIMVCLQEQKYNSCWIISIRLALETQNTSKNENPSLGLIEILHDSIVICSVAYAH